MLHLQHERRYRTENWLKDLFLGHLRPGIDKNSEDLAILILEFDDVTVKTTYKKKVPIGLKGIKYCGPNCIFSFNF